MKLRGLRDTVAEDDPFLDITPNRVDRQYMPERKEAGRERFVLAHEPEQNMLRCYHLRSVLKSFVTSEEDNPTGPLRIPFKHKDSKNRISRCRTDYSEKSADAANFFQDVISSGFSLVKLQRPVESKEKGE